MFLFSILAPLALAACGDPCGTACEDREPRPIQGEPAQFTAGPLQTDAFNVSLAVPCTRPDDGVRVAITGKGAIILEPEARRVWFDALRADLEQVGFTSWSSGFGLSCVDAAPPASFFATDDWARLDAAVHTISDAIAADDLAEHVELRVGEEQLICPQATCAY